MAQCDPCFISTPFLRLACVPGDGGAGSRCGHNCEHELWDRCAVGCAMCDDLNVLFSTGLPSAGPSKGIRWARPRLNPSSMARNMYGLLAPLESMETLGVTSGTQFQSAACWDVFGGECYDKQICDCTYTVKHVCICGDECQPGVPCCDPGQYIKGTFPDCFHFLGISQPTSEPWIQCRKCDESHEMNFVPGPRTKRGPDMLQVSEVRFNGPCTSNRGIPCWGRQTILNRCCLPAQCPPEECPDVGPPCKYYIDQNWPRGEDLWDKIQLKWFIEGGDDGPHFMHHKDFAWNDFEEAHLDFRNRIMRYIRTNAHGILGLGRVDHPMDGRDGINFEIDMWRRHRNGFTHGECGWKVETWKNCYLKNSNCRVEVDWLIKDVIPELSMYLQHRPTEHEDESSYLFARFQLQVSMTAQVRFVDGPCKLGGQKLRFIEDECDRYRIKGGLDEIVFIDPDGRRVHPPWEFRWFGGRSAMAVEHESDVYSREAKDECKFISLWGDRCCTLAASINSFDVDGGYEVPGMPTRLPLRPDPPRRGQPPLDRTEAMIFGGRVAFKIDPGNIRELCKRRCHRASGGDWPAG